MDTEKPGGYYRRSRLEAGQRHVKLDRPSGPSQARSLPAGAGVTMHLAFP
jgi:hypothetical protein